MNKTMTITVIVFVAVIMGMSVVAPAMAFQAEPDKHDEPHPPRHPCSTGEEKSGKSRLPCNTPIGTV